MLTFGFITTETCVLAGLYAGGHGVPPLRWSILFLSQPGRVSVSNCAQQAQRPATTRSNTQHLTSKI